MTAAEAAPGRMAADVGLRQKLFIGLLFLVTFFQGVRAGSVPIPSSLLFCFAYILLFDPLIPRDIGAVFATVFTVILLLSAHNSLAASGGMRDFLYIGIVLESFVFTICLIDTMRFFSKSDLTRILTILTVSVVLLELVEFLNLFDFDTLFRPLLTYWDGIANASYGSNGDYTQRAPGSFGSPTVAGFTTYLLIRSLALVSGKRWIAYLSAIPLVICAARTAVAVFIVWELAVPILSSRYRMYAIAGVATVLGLFAASVIYFPEIYEKIYLVSFFIEAYHTGKLTTNDSIVYRLFGLQWALSQPLMQWIVGGMTATEMNQFANNYYTFDSEFVQRTMQFGLIGYGCFLLMNLCAGFNYRSWDWWFGVAIVAIGSITNYVATSLIIFPFLVLYNVCLRRHRQELEAPEAAPA
jgi:hypothetical protein